MMKPAADAELLDAIDAYVAGHGWQADDGAAAAEISEVLNLRELEL